MDENKHSKCTLYPMSEKNKEEFTKFRNDDIADMFFYPCLFATIGTGATALTAVIDWSEGRMFEVVY